MDYAIVVAIEFVYAIAALMLISLGLAIVFGMMRIINLAHGEFMVMGSYSATVAVHHGVNVWVSILIVPPIVVGLIGLVVERLVIRHLYGRMVETMLATWGLSLFVVGLLTMVFGDTTEGVPTPLRGIAVGGYQTSGYSLFVIVLSVATMFAVYAVLRTTRLGLLARGTMQNAEMAAALGTDTAKIYAVTFAFGAALAGFAGGVLAPISGVFPSIGGSYIGRAFITVIGGGSAPLVGTASASTLFGIINQIATFASNPVFGEVALLLAAIVLIRTMPQGITGRYFRGALVTKLLRAHLDIASIGLLGVALLIALPLTLDLFDLLQITLYAILSILALSLAFIWGYGGILCFGHAAFFGVGAYAYAVASINIGESTIPLLIAIALPAALAAGLGYFMFYARVSDVYVGVITLTVSLILYNSINSTAGPEYRIGEALLGGFNGIPNIPSLNIPLLPDATLDPEDMYVVSMGLLLLVYFGLNALLATRFGRVLVAIRENEQRVEFLGYDARLHKLVAFTIGGGLAGLAGCLFAVWGNYVSPNVFGVVQSAQIIIWLMVGGSGTLIGPVIGCVAISWLTARIGTQQVVNANVVLGAILLVFVLLVPKGIVPVMTERLVPWLFSRKRSVTVLPHGSPQEGKA